MRDSASHNTCCRKVGSPFLNKRSEDKEDVADYSEVYALKWATFTALAEQNGREKGQFGSPYNALGGVSGLALYQTPIQEFLRPDDFHSYFQAGHMYLIEN